MDGYVTIGTVLDTKEFDKELSKLEKSTNKQEDKLNIKGKAELETSQAQKKLNDLENKVNKTGQAISVKLSKSFMVGMSGLNAVATKITDMFAKSLSGAISRVDTINNFANVMGNLGVNTQDAQESIDYMAEKLTGLPTTLDDAVSSVQRFTSANNNVKASTEMFLALNNALLAGGAPIQQQAAALEQLSQAYAKGKPDMMEWRTALSAMPAQLKQVAIAMGYVSADQLGEALRNGEVSMNDFMTTLVKMNREGINGFASLEEQARTGTGGIATTLTNLKTAFVKAMAEILQTIGQANIASFFQTIINIIKAVVPYLAYFTKIFISAINIVANAIGSIVNFIDGLFGKKTSKKVNQLSGDISGVSSSVSNLADNTSGVGSSMDKTTGSAKKLNKELKQLSKFDEMNILQKNEDTSSKGSGGGASGGSLGDLGNFGDISKNVSNAINPIVDAFNKLGASAEIFTAALLGIGAAFAAWKISQVLTKLGLLDKALGVTSLVSIGLFVAGTYLLIKSVADLILNWDKLTKKQKLMKVSLAALGGAFITLGVMVKKGFSVASLATGGFLTIVTTLIAVVGTLIYKWSQEEKSISSVKDATNRLKEAKDRLKRAEDEQIAAVDRLRDAEKNLQEVQEQTNINAKALFEEVKNGTRSYKDLNDAEREAYKAQKELYDATENLKSANKELDNSNKNLTMSEWKKKQSVAESKGEYMKYRDEVIKAYNDGSLKAEQAAELISRSMAGMDKETQKIFVDGVPKKIKSSLDPEKYKSSTEKFVGSWNTMMGRLKKDITIKVEAAIKVASTVGGAGLTALALQSKLKSAKGAIVTLPKLAVGGVVNQPGRGVPLGNAIIGERGAEGVIPLTDSQQMALLGEAIGKYININATVPVYVGNRQVAREIRKINAEDDFAYNR